MTPQQQDELRQAVVAIRDNEDGHWGKVISLARLSPVRITYMFNNGAFIRVIVGQIGGAFSEACSVAEDGCPLVLRKVEELLSKNRALRETVQAFRGYKFDMVFKINGDSVLSCQVNEA